MQSLFFDAITHRFTQSLTSYTGYYCVPGSTSPRQTACGSTEVYCPIGSLAPIRVDIGYYSIPYINTSSSNSKNNVGSHVNYSCLNAVNNSSCSSITSGSNEEGYDGSTQVSELIAPLGSYATHGVKYLCPAGRYGNSTGTYV